MADFFGPDYPGELITVDEYKEVIQAFPRAGFSDQFLQIMCGLCALKSETTYDNLVADFGCVFTLLLLRVINMTRIEMDVWLLARLPRFIN